MGSRVVRGMYSTLLNKALTCCSGVSVFVNTICFTPNSQFIHFICVSVSPHNKPAISNLNLIFVVKYLYYIISRAFNVAILIQ